MKDIQISVVIPLYNSTNSILETIKSVLNQTFLPYEIIIINDGSTDDSLAKVQKFIEQYNGNLNFKVIDKINEGVSKTRNLGIANASGNWIAFLDSDDIWLPNKLELQRFEINKNDNIDLIGTNRNGEVFKNFGLIKFNRLNKISSRILLYKNFFSTPTVMIKKHIIKDIGLFDENQKYAEEGDYWIRICNKKNCYLLNESLVLTGGGKPDFGFSGLSGNLKEMEKGELKNLLTARKMGVIGSFEYYFLVIYSLLKYWRRIIIVKLRK